MMFGRNPSSRSNLKPRTRTSSEEDAGPDRGASEVLPVVGDVDHEPAVRTRAGQGEGAERKPGPDADAEGGLALEAAGVGDLAERAVAGDVHQLASVGRVVGRVTLVV